MDLSNFEDYRIPHILHLKERFVCIEGYNSQQILRFQVLVKVLTNRAIKKAYLECQSKRKAPEQTGGPASEAQVTEAIQKVEVHATEVIVKKSLDNQKVETDTIGAKLMEARLQRSQETQQVLDRLKSQPLSEIGQIVQKKLRQTASLQSEGSEESIPQKGKRQDKPAEEVPRLDLKQSNALSQHWPSIRDLNGPDSTRSIYGNYSSRIGLLAKQSLEMRQNTVMTLADSESQLNSSRLTSWHASSRTHLDRIAGFFKDLGGVSSTAPQTAAQVNSRAAYNPTGLKVVSQVDLQGPSSKELPTIEEKPNKKQTAGGIQKSDNPGPSVQRRTFRLNSIRKLETLSVRHHQSIMESFAHASLRERLEAARREAELQRQPRYKETKDSLLNGMEDPAFSARNGFKEPLVVVDDSEEILDDVTSDRFRRYLTLHPNSRKGFFKPMTDLARQEAMETELEEARMREMESRARKLEGFFEQPNIKIVSSKVYVDAESVLPHPGEDIIARKREQAHKLATYFNQP